LQGLDVAEGLSLPRVVVAGGFSLGEAGKLLNYSVNAYARFNQVIQ
jgi:hypothetical protein